MNYLDQSESRMRTYFYCQGQMGPLGKPRRRCVDNIIMDLREMRWDGMDWIELAQDRDQWRALVNR
jgi:hypothetical protein